MLGNVWGAVQNVFNVFDTCLVLCLELIKTPNKSYYIFVAALTFPIIQPVHCPGAGGSDKHIYLQLIHLVCEVDHVNSL